MSGTSKHAPMPQTVEAYKELAERDLELFQEMRDEISELKVKVNKLQQKLNKKGK